MDHNGRANEIVNKNWVVIVKLKGSNPLIFQVKIEKQVNRNGVVNFLSGFNAEHNPLIISLMAELEGFEEV